jgi:hypothetical protein
MSESERAASGPRPPAARRRPDFGLGPGPQTRNATAAWGADLAPFITARP